MAQQLIEVRFDEDELFGYDPDDRAGTDVEASKVRWIALITARLAEDYPGVAVDIRETNEGEVGTVRCWGFDDREEYVAVNDGIEQVWVSQGWVVGSEEVTA